MSDTIFADIKSRLPLIDVISRECAGITLKGQHLSECPFCGHHGCCSIDKDKFLYKCHSCGEGGDIFIFFEKRRNIDRGESLKILAGWAGVDLPEPDNAKPKKEKRESKQEKIFRLALEHYEAAMAADNSVGQAWFCKTRGHATLTLKKMRVGMATGTLLPFLKEQGIEPEDVIDAGLADNAKDGQPVEPYDYFRKGWAIFPVIDVDGRMLTFKSKDPQKKAPGIPLRGEKSWLLNHASLGSPDLFIVEGENDIASLMDSGFDNVVGTGGGPGKDQVRLIRNFQANRTIYLWFDKDPDKDPMKNEGGVHHTRYIYKALATDSMIIKVISQPGKAKDPDDYLQGLFREGKSVAEVRRAVRELLSSSLTPLGWELEQLRLIPDSIRRLEAFKERKLPQEISRMLSRADQEAYIKMASESMEISMKAVQDLVDAAGDLMAKMKDAFKEMKTADPIKVAEFIYREMSNGGGGRFFKTPDKRFWLHHGRQTFEIANNPDFASLMQRTMHLVPVEKPGSTVLHCLQNFCNMHGEYVEMMSWLWTDRERDTIYINMNSPHNKILRLVPGHDPAMIDNGTNEQSVLLSSSNQIRQFEYQQTASEAEGFAALKELLMDTTPADTPQKYFLICWLLSTFVMNYQTDRGLLQIIGSTQTGKSKVAERMSQLVFGESYVGKGTGASETRVATSAPMVILDNLENKNLAQGTVDFLLFIANSANKPKAKSGSDTDVLFQKLNTMAVITSIEAFPGRLPELINRTFALLLEGVYRQHGYMHDECMRQITKHRNLILSAVFKMIAKDVLSRLSERKDWSKHIQQQYPGHNKERNNEHLCTMMLLLEGLLKYIPKSKDKDKPIKTQASEILHAWISCQEEHAKETSTTSNTLLMFMDGLAHEIMVKMRGKDIPWQEHPEFPGIKVKVYDDPEYHHEFYLTYAIEEDSLEDDEFMEMYSRLEFIIPSPRLYEIISMYYRNQNERNKFETATALQYRLRNDKATMESNGWEYVTRESLADRYTNGERAKPAEFAPSNSQYKKIMGHWHWRFSKKVRPVK